MKRTSYAAAALLLALMAAWVGGAAHAQGQPIAYGAVVVGNIGEQDAEVNYQFQGSAGDMVLITMNADEGDLSFNAFLTLLDPDGEEVVVNDNGGHIYNAQILTPLPADGTYTIVASAARETTGRYTLSLSQVKVQTIAYGDVVTGSIPDRDTLHFYQFEGAEGDVIAISMEAPYIAYAADNFDSRLRLFDAAGNALEYDSDTGALLDALIITRLPADGAYIIEADASDGTPGDYTLSLGPAQVLELGVPMVVVHNTWETQASFALDGAPGDVFTFAVRPLGQSDPAFKPEVIVSNSYDEALVRVVGLGLRTFSVTLPTESFIIHDPPESGLYVVKVSNDDYDTDGYIEITLVGHETAGE